MKRSFSDEKFNDNPLNATSFNASASNTTVPTLPDNTSSQYHLVPFPGTDEENRTVVERLDEVLAKTAQGTSFSRWYHRAVLNSMMQHLQDDESFFRRINHSTVESKAFLEQLMAEYKIIKPSLHSGLWHFRHVSKAALLANMKVEPASEDCLQAIATSTTSTTLDWFCGGLALFIMILHIILAVHGYPNSLFLPGTIALSLMPIRSYFLHLYARHLIPPLRKKASNLQTVCSLFPTDVEPDIMWSTDLPSKPLLMSTSAVPGTTNSIGPGSSAALLQDFKDEFKDETANGVMLRLPDRNGGNRTLAVDRLLKHVMILACKQGTRQITYWSQRCVDVTGFKEEDVIGTDLLSLFVDTDSKSGILRCLQGSRKESLVYILSQKQVMVPVLLGALATKSLAVETEGDVYFLLSEVTSNHAHHQVHYAFVVNFYVQEVMHLTSQTPPDLALISQRLAFISQNKQLQKLAHVWGSSFCVSVGLANVIGKVCTRINKHARKKGKKVSLMIARGVPTTIYWNEEVLSQLAYLYGMFAMLRTETGAQTKILVERVPIGSAHFIALKIVSNGMQTLPRYSMSSAPSSGSGMHVVTLPSNSTLPTSSQPGSVHLSLDAYHVLGTAYSTGSDYSSEISDQSTRRDTLGSFRDLFPTEVDATTLAERSPVLLSAHEEWGGRYESCEETVSFLFPEISTDLHVQSAMESSNDPNEVLPPIGQVQQGPALNILIFEPNPVFRMMFAQFMWSRGHAVLLAKDVDTLVYLFESSAVHVVVFDVESKEGTSSLSGVRTLCEDTGAVLVTSSHDVDFENNTHLVKPFAREEMISIEKKAWGHIKTMQQREAQVKMLREIISEKKVYQWTRGECIGKGSFGEVYLANDLVTGGRMAVKIVPLETASQEAKAKGEELINEIDILRTVDHPNIVRYLHCERTVATVNIFMEYVDGGSLLKLCKRRAEEGRPIANMAPFYIRQLLEGVMYLHEVVGIVHRDIKAANVLLSGREVRLSDFGCAKRMTDGVVEGTVGTMRWMAPEVMRGGAYTCACDIWSVGCLLMELLTGGNQPFADTIRGTPIAFFTYVSNLPADMGGALPHGLDHQISTEAAEFLEACLQINPMLRLPARTLLTHPYITATTVSVMEQLQRSFSTEFQSPTFRKSSEMRGRTF